MSICHDMSAQKNGLKGTLYESESLSVKAYQKHESPILSFTFTPA